MRINKASAVIPVTLDGVKTATATPRAPVRKLQQDEREEGS